MLESLLSDLRLALRSLRRSPAFALVAVSSLALGIGANVAIFSFVNAILLKHLPVPDAARLVAISESHGSKQDYTAFSYLFIHELNARSNGLLAGVFGRFPVRVSLTSSGAAAEPLNGEVVTGAYFHTLGVHAELGRVLDDGDISAGTGNPVCVISHSLWQQRFAGDPNILAQKLTLNSHLYTIVGVTPAGFHGPQLDSRIDLQIPVSRMADFMGGFFATVPGGAVWKSPGFMWLQPLARLRPGITRAEAEGKLQTLAQQLKLQLAMTQGLKKSASENTTLRLVDGSAGVNPPRQRFGQPVLILMGVVALVLLIACANLANLLLARAGARQKEFAVRLSLGASRARLLRQLMIESLTIALAGGAFGLLLSFWLVHTLIAYLNSGAQAGAGIQATPDLSVLAFSIGLSVATAALFGLAPAFQSIRPDVLPELKQLSAGSTGQGHQTTLRKALIVFQLALSLVMLFAAGLFTQTLSHLQTIDLGFRPEKVIAMSVDPAMSGRTPADTERILDEILGRVRSTGAIAAASLTVVSPLEGSVIALDTEVPGHIDSNSDIKPAFNMISPGYFSTLHQPLLLGRDFSDHDNKGSAHVAIVNESFVSQYMPGRNPVGQHFQAAGNDTEIIGLVKTARYASIREQPTPQVYLPAKQTRQSGYTLMVRTTANPATVIADVEHAVHAVDPKIPVYNVRTLQAQLDQGISSERVLSFLSMLFSVLATLLCTIGLYGIIAYGVSRRTREIGLRFAIGAQKSDVAALFLREALLLVGCGILVGVPTALAAARLLNTVLFGVAAGDVPTLAITTVLLAAAALLATFVPVRRAATIEPLEALRYE